MNKLNKLVTVIEDFRSDVSSIDAFGDRESTDIEVLIADRKVAFDVRDHIHNLMLTVDVYDPEVDMDDYRVTVSLDSLADRIAVVDMLRDSGFIVNYY